MPAFPKPQPKVKPLQFSSFARKPMPEKVRTPAAPLIRIVNTARISVKCSPQPKRVYVRSPALLAAIRTLPCMHSGVVGRTQAAHSNWADWGGKGKAIKASDEYCAALSVEVHAELDQGKRWTEAERRTIWRAAWVRTVREVIKRGLWPENVPIPDIRTHQ